MKETLSINSTDFEVRRSQGGEDIGGFDTGAETFFIAAPTKLAGTDILRILSRRSPPYGQTTLQQNVPSP